MRDSDIVNPNVLDYVYDHSLRSSHPVLERAREETSKMEAAIMQISPEEGQFLQFMVRLINAKKCIEVGVFTGYSSTAMALALPEDGKIHALDVNQEYTDKAREYWKEAQVDHKIDLTIAPATETLDKLIADESNLNTFDFGFVDADKTNYKNYYERLLKLIRPGGLILFDNMLWSGKVCDDTINDDATVALRELNDILHHDDRVHLSLLPFADGISMVMKK
eukprot:gb/GECH01013582.1/.p1 GENE.gb/GECH01013582.1/~~gb/GECH01013582.1/.p1  ORF type:complete len:222 (+),score=70.84 gb/GECH01013582.1/:1-666(+)